MISSILSRLVILVFGTLYPAYASYKTVRNKDLREYVKWMMYWVVFALFTCAETFTDVLLSFWFPFYYEFKIIVVFWLLLPATKGSSILYRKFVHPTLTKREKEIDEAIMNAKAQGYTTFLRLGARGLDYAKYVLMETAIKGLQNKGQFLPSVSNSSSTTAVDGGGRSHPSESANGIPESLDFHMKPMQIDPLEVFQYSDDDDEEMYIPPKNFKPEVEEREAEVEEEETTRTRPKRRSARSRKQVIQLQPEIDEDD